MADMSRLSLVGYSMGGAVGLLAAYFDQRIQAVAALSGFTPMRSDPNTAPSGGIQRFYDWHGLVPRLGLFRDNLTQIPYDWDEVLAALAPRAVLAYTPGRDRDANPAAVNAACATAAKAWTKAPGNFTQLSPPDRINVFNNIEVSHLFPHIHTFSAPPCPTFFPPHWPLGRFWLSPAGYTIYPF